MDLLGFSLTTLRISAFVTSVLVIARPPDGYLMFCCPYLVDQVEFFQFGCMVSDRSVDSEFQSDGLGILGSLAYAIQDLKFDFRAVSFVVHQFALQIDGFPLVPSVTFVMYPWVRSFPNLQMYLCFNDSRSQEGTLEKSIRSLIVTPSGCARIFSRMSSSLMKFMRIPPL